MAKYLDNSGLARVWDKVKSHVSGQPFVRYDSQSLSDAYKLQARTNIDAAKSDAHTNPNLLDNAYFVGGGSQLGDGVFPINQRGTTFYSLSYGNIFDRWHIQGSATSTCTLNSNGIAFATSTENCGLSQTIPRGRIVDGETYTLSVMDTAGNIYSGSRVLNTNASWQNFNLGLSAFGWYNPCYVAANGQTNVYILDRTGSGGSASIGLAAAKLEKGTVSTLANDVPPDFGEELRKCQRYLWVYKVGANTPIGNGATFGTSSAIDVVTPVPMRAGNVTASFNVTPYIVYDGGLGICDAGAAIISHNGTGNHLRWQIGHSGTNIQGHSLVTLLAGNDTTFTFSNEL